MVYLDANASERLRPEARAAMLAALDVTGNPASVHAPGRAARRLLEDARDTLARLYGGRAEDLVFTSGGTEADALAVHALGHDRRIIIGATEHDAIRAAAPTATMLPVDHNGVADMAVLRSLLSELPKALVCLMLANNETGVLQPIAEAAELCRATGAWLHVDAVQAAGRLRISLADLGAHSMALSSHKLGGPAGAGALLLCPETSHIMPLITGGGQERGRRGGTPPVAAIAGFAAAAHAAAAGFIEAGSMGPDSADDCAGSGAEDVGAVGVGAGASMVDVGAVDSSTVGAGARSGVGAIQSNGVRPGAAEAGAIRSSGLRLGAVEAGARLAALRDAIESAAVGCGAIVCGAGAPRLANTTCLALPGVRADGQVISLDLDGVAVSAGAACSSGKVATSHVLTAMGLGPLAGQAIRVSLPWNATQADVAAFAAAYSRMADRLRPALAPRAA